MRNGVCSAVIYDAGMHVLKLPVFQKKYFKQAIPLLQGIVAEKSFQKFPVFFSRDIFNI